MNAQPEPPTTDEVRVIGLRGVPEVRPGDDLARVALDAAAATDMAFRAGDILVVTQKIVSKAEGALVDLRSIEPAPLARSFAERWGKDPRYIEVVLRETARLVRMDRGLIISETRHGLICANAGVDASNVEGDLACLLPRDPDASAQRLRAELERRAGVALAVIISDSFGRPWRNGITNVAIGVAGMAPLVDYRGRPDDHGRVMSASILAVADEVAAAAELVSGKVNRRPLVLVRGYTPPAGEGSGRDLVMDPAMDMFR